MEQQHSEESFLGSLQNELVQASHGQRFVNFIIDRIIFYLLNKVLIFFNIYYLSAVADILGEINVYVSVLFYSLISLVIYGFYMFLIELIFTGQSLGKLITGTKAVNFDGSLITPKTALLRGLSRIVPFEIFSALGTPCFPWHDAWTKTYVIDLKKSIIITEG